ncbi:MAG TPA: hypothetical protein VGX00_07765 [Thermoplasmata archaeon]|nr:hypothetical protein [Thermoplasmata archaeon]
MAAEAEIQAELLETPGLETTSRIERYTRLMEVVESHLPPTNSSLYCPGEIPDVAGPSHRVRQRDMERRIRILNVRRP